METLRKSPPCEYKLYDEEGEYDGGYNRLFANLAVKHMQ
jgi:hypothetical protein